MREKINTEKIQLSPPLHMDAFHEHVHVPFTQQCRICVKTWVDSLDLWLVSHISIINRLLYRHYITLLAERWLVPAQWSSDSLICENIIVNPVFKSGQLRNPIEI